MLSTGVPKREIGSVSNAQTITTLLGSYVDVVAHRQSVSAAREGAQLALAEPAWSGPLRRAILPQCPLPQQ